METYPLTIRPRCDTENEWIKYNPVLKNKEFVVSIDKSFLRDHYLPPQFFLDLLVQSLHGYIGHQCSI